MNKWFILAPILACYLWWRLRRNVGRQSLRARWLVYSVVAFGVPTVAFAGWCLPRPALALGWGAGLALGLILGRVGLRITRFESGPEGRFYTPNMQIGFFLALIFVGRLGYRLSVLGGGHAIFSRWPTPTFGNSALTYLAFELLAGYYLAFNLGVLRRFRTLTPISPPA
jgi:hypothetical protein